MDLQVCIRHVGSLRRVLGLVEVHAPVAVALASQALGLLLRLSLIVVQNDLRLRCVVPAHARFLLEAPAVPAWLALQRLVAPV